jgi:hypothetical protein
MGEPVLRVSLQASLKLADDAHYGSIRFIIVRLYHQHISAANLPGRAESRQEHHFERYS